MDETRTYTCSYIDDGREIVVHVEATSWEDAELELQAMGIDGTVDGELIEEYEVEGLA